MPCASDPPSLCLALLSPFLAIWVFAGSITTAANTLLLLPHACLSMLRP